MRRRALKRAGGAGRAAGPAGGAVSYTHLDVYKRQVLGTILPPMVILSVISLFYAAFAANRWVALALKGMQAGVAAVILDVEMCIRDSFYGSGGSKLNETARSYKTLALETDTIDGFTFVWFTDGKGLSLIHIFGWEEMGDLSAISASRDAYKEKYIATYPDAKKGSIATSAGMLYQMCIRDRRWARATAFKASKSSFPPS